MRTCKVEILIQVEWCNTLQHGAKPCNVDYAGATWLCQVHHGLSDTFLVENSMLQIALCLVQGDY
jgi:hypothetical protein